METTTNINLRIKPEEKKALQRLAHENYMSLSEFLKFKAFSTAITLNKN